MHANTQHTFLQIQNEYIGGIHQTIIEWANIRNTTLPSAIDDCYDDVDIDDILWQNAHPYLRSLWNPWRKYYNKWHNNGHYNPANDTTTETQTSGQDMDAMPPTKLREKRKLRHIRTIYWSWRNQNRLLRLSPLILFYDALFHYIYLNDKNLLLHILKCHLKKCVAATVPTNASPPSATLH